MSPQAGALGGGVNFRTLQPTQALQVRASGTTGTFDRSNYALAATGSIGSLGLALQHTWRGSNSPLTFQDYEDQSGLTYPHEGESTSLGDFLKFRYRLGDDRTTDQRHGADEQPRRARHLRARRDDLAVRHRPGQSKFRTLRVRVCDRAVAGRNRSDELHGVREFEPPDDR